MNSLERSWRSAFRPPDRRAIYEWANDHVIFPPGSPIPGPFDIKNAPWIRRIFDCLKDPSIRRITVLGTPQESGKTIAAIIWMMHQQVNGAGTFGYYIDTEVKSKELAGTKLGPLMDRSRLFLEKVSRRHKQEIQMKDGNYILFLGKEAEGNRQSHTFKFIIKDEFHLWSITESTEVDNRKQAYSKTKDWKILEIGNGPDEGTIADNNFHLGTMEEWNVKSPHSGKYFPLKFRKSEGGVFRWDEVHRDDGTLDIDATAETTYIECPHTGKRIEWSVTMADRLSSSGKYIATNPKAKNGHVSLRISRFVPGKTEWSEIVADWLRITAGRGLGKKEALRRFVRYDLCETWEEKPDVQKQNVRKGRYTRQQMLDGRWDREFIRAATIDYQHGMRGEGAHFWFIARAYAENGDSRLIDGGKVMDDSELYDRIRDAGVVQLQDASQWEFTRTLIDCAYDPNTVHELCERYLWMGLRGEDKQEKNQNFRGFLHKVRKKNKTYQIYKHFSELKWKPLGVGTRSRLGHALWRSFDSQRAQDMLNDLRKGESHEWLVPEDIEDFLPEYEDHMNSHGRINVSKNEREPLFRWERIGSAEKYPDHLYDCETHQVIFALMAELYSSMSEEPSE